MFLEDKYEKMLQLEGDVISVSQLQPGDSVTVRHSTYSAYEVTATLLKFPTEVAGSELLWEVAIAATDSEPGNNEDSRAVKHTEVIIVFRVGIVM